MNRPAGWGVVVAAIFGLIAEPCPASAQLATPTLTGSIKFKAQARVQELFAGETSPKLHWVLAEFPAPAAVSFANSDAQTLVLQAIADVTANQGNCTHWALEPRTSCSYPAALVSKLKAISFAQANVLTGPTAAGTEQEVEVRFQYHPRAHVNPNVDSLTVIVSTVFFARPAKPGNPRTEQPSTWQGAAADVGTAPPAAGGSVPITLQFTRADRMKSRGGLVDPQVVTKALEGVAIVGLEKIREMKCLPGSPAPTGATIDSIDTALEQSLVTGVPGWAGPVVSFGPLEGTGDYVLRFSGVRIVSGVSVEIERGQIQGAAGMVDFTGATPAIEKSIEDALAHAGKDAEARIKPQIDSLVGHVPTVANVRAGAVALRSTPEISGNVDVRGRFSGLVFSGTRRWSAGSLNVQSTLAGSLTPENSLSGQTSLDGSNLLRNILHVDVNETYNMAIQAGPEVQNANLTFAIPRTRGTDWVLNYGFTQGFYYTRDWNQRFGNDQPSDPKLINRQEGMKPAVYVEVVRQPGNKFPWVLSTKLQASYDWRAVLIEPRLAGAANLQEGQVAAPTFEFTQLAGFDSTGFVSSVRLQITALARRGTHALGGDYAFQQFTASARGEIFFGRKRNSDYFLRYERGLGYSSQGTPLSELMRLGGPSSLRGLENGEYIGRDMAYDRSGAGISALKIADLFRGKAAADNATNSSSDNSAPGGFNLASVYLVGFYDRGRVLDGAHPGDLLSVGPALHGYGIAGEIRKLPAAGKQANISIGWAKSPQSRLHSRGLMTIGVNFDF